MIEIKNKNFTCLFSALNSKEVTSLSFSRCTNRASLRERVDVAKVGRDDDDDEIRAKIETRLNMVCEYIYIYIFVNFGV